MDFRTIDQVYSTQMDILKLQQPQPQLYAEEHIDTVYIAALGRIIKLWVESYASRNPTKRKYYWADYLGTGLKKPSYAELKAVGRHLRTQFTNVNISIETTITTGAKCGMPHVIAPRWNRLTFRW
jgi:hypothetical protein